MRRWEVFRRGMDPRVTFGEDALARMHVIGCRPDHAHQFRAAGKRRNRLQQTGKLDGRHKGDNRGDEHGGDLAAGEC